MAPYYRPAGRKPESHDNYIEEGLLDTVKVFAPSTLKSTFTGDTPITKVEEVTSYSWLQSVEPTILVPGCPTLYKGFCAPMQVRPDSSQTFIDKASSLLPEAPLLPLFEAIRASDVNHDFAQYEIITGRGQLKKLLGWVLNHQKKPFRIDIECNGTGGLLFRRWEVKFIDQGRNKGNVYRMDFESKTCALVKGCEDTFSHERVMTYNLCGLQMLVQFEVDGFQLPDDIAHHASEICSSAGKDTTDDLITALSQLNVGGTQLSQSAGDSLLTVLPYVGHVASHCESIELKTRSCQSRVQMKASEIYEQAAWTAASKTIVAKHDNDNFLEEDVYTLKELEKNDEVSKAKDGVIKVADFLKQLLDLLKNEPKGSRFCLISKDTRGGSLALRKGGRGAGVLRNER